jgi:hypothetical protein
MRKITLKREETVLNVSGNHLAYRLSVVAESEDVDPKVFIYYQLPRSPYNTQEPTAEFQAVVGPPQYLEIPADSPELSISPYFRTDFLTLDFPSLHTARDFWAQLVEEIKTLMRSIKIAETLEIQEILEITDED